MWVSIGRYRGGWHWLPEDDGREYQIRCASRHVEEPVQCVHSANSEYYLGTATSSPTTGGGAIVIAHASIAYRHIGALH